MREVDLMRGEELLEIHILIVSHVNSESILVLAWINELYNMRMCDLLHES